MLFEWDEEKARKNIIHHGISFDVAKLVFNDPYHIEIYDEDHSIDEDRYIAIGLVENVLFVVFTIREYNRKEEIIRLISARVLTPQERREYYDD